LPKYGDFLATVCRTVRPMLSYRCLSYPVCPVLSVTFVYCGQAVGWIKMKLGTQVGLSPGNIVLDGDPAPPPPKEGAAPNFRPMYVVAKWLDGSRCHLAGREVGLSPSHIVLDEDPAPLPQREQSPQFSAHVYCGHSAGWIKMKLGAQVGLIVLDGDSDPPLTEGQSPQFSSHICCCQTAGWIKMSLGTHRESAQATLY